MDDEYNIYIDRQDTSIMTKDELAEYGLSRMRMMLKLEADAVRWLEIKNTPFQQMVLETARHHVALCEEKYGISRHDMRLRSARAL